MPVAQDPKCRSRRQGARLIEAVLHLVKESALVEMAGEQLGQQNLQLRQVTGEYLEQLQIILPFNSPLLLLNGKSMNLTT